MFEIGGDLHILAAANRTDFFNAGNFLRKADAARAMDAARHDRLDHRTHIFLGDRALVHFIARMALAIGHGLILQIALTTLVANRTIKRMIDEKEFHHAFARRLDHFGRRENLLALGCRQRTAGLRLGRSGLHFNQAHAAVAGDRQPLMIAETRNFLARQLARLKNSCALGNLDLGAVYGDLRHRRSPDVSTPVSRQSNRQPAMPDIPNPW